MYSIFEIIIGILFSLLGAFIIYRTFKPVTSKYEIEKQDLTEIHQSWYGDGQPTEEYIYEQSCEMEKARTNSKILFRVVGLLIIAFGIGLIIEIIK